MTTDERQGRDDPMFNHGVIHTVELLAKTLGVTDWVAGDGSEDYDEDLAQTLMNIIEAKGLYSSEDGSWAALPAAQAADGWQDIASAPRGSDIHILLHTTCHGLVEAWFAKGEWSEHHEYGREYSGSVWVCADDAFQIEVEEFKNEAGDIEFHDGTATHWRPLPAPPAIIAEQREKP